MRMVLSCGDVKQAALYFDKVVPLGVELGDVSTHDDAVLPAKVLYSILENQPYSRTAPMKFNQLNAVASVSKGTALSAAVCASVARDNAYTAKTAANAATAELVDWLRKLGRKHPERLAEKLIGMELRKPYADVQSRASTTRIDARQKLVRAYLEDQTIDGVGSIRERLHDAFPQLAGERCDLLLPTTQSIEPAVTGNPVLSLVGLNLIDTTHASWEQIMEIRADRESRTRLHRLRAFVDMTYTNKAVSFIEDDITQRLDQYDRARRKHGFDVVTSTLTSVIDAKNLHAAAALGLAAAIFGGPAAAVSGAVCVELAGVAVQFAKTRKAQTEWSSAHEMAYLVAARSKLSASPLDA